MENRQSFNTFRKKQTINLNPFIGEKVHLLDCYLQLQNMRRLTLLILVLVTLFSPAYSFACKEPILEDTFPITNFEEYDYVVIVKIDKSVNSDNFRYNPLVSFEARVLESIKGDFSIDASFSGKAMKEEARAVCPVHLEENGTYLLLLSKENGEYLLSRFSLPVKNDHQYFDNYIRQIKTLIGKE